ncbi:MAG: serine hydrolase, partial [Pseudomonadota bacterium]|nr:serine hydrolase [Pseudomonadota bacterium]
SGGAHWGGGLWISARDHARVGLLMANHGQWNGRRLIDEAWIAASLTPSALNPSYGFLWWLNAAGAQAPSAPRDSYFARGVGANIIWVAPAQNLVTVVRWIDRERFDDFVGAVMAALA